MNQAHEASENPSAGPNPGQPSAEPAVASSSSKHRSSPLGHAWLGRVTRNFLIPWLLMSSLLVYLAHLLIEPSYQASSLVLVEKTIADPFTGEARGDAMETGPAYLKTQAVSVTSDPVLGAAFVVAPEIAQFAMFKDSKDPAAELRRKLNVHILPNTNFLQISLESNDPQEAATVVNAVTTAYKLSTQPETHSVVPPGIKVLGDATVKAEISQLEDYKHKHIDKKVSDLENELIGLARECDLSLLGPDSSAPLGTRSALRPNLPPNSGDRSRMASDQLMQTEFQILDLETKLQAREETLRQAQNQGKKPAGAEEQGRERQADVQIQEVVQQLRAATLKKERLTSMLKKAEIRREGSTAASVRASLVQDELRTLRSLSDQVDRKLAQLKFCQGKMDVMIPRIDRAKVPKSPVDSRRLLMMALAPAAVLAGLLGLSLISRAVSTGKKPTESDITSEH